MEDLESRGLIENENHQDIEYTNSDISSEVEPNNVKKKGCCFEFEFGRKFNSKFGNKSCLGLGLGLGLGLFLSLIALITMYYASIKGRGKKPLLILISLDGGSPFYLERGLTPNLKSFSHGPFIMKSSFPSITFPNHYTLVTGVYPETHKIVGNEFYDPVLNETFSYHSPLNNGEAKWWSAAEPIWITAEKSGIVSATCFWVGSEAPFGKNQIRPHYWKQFSFVEIPQQLDWVFQWIELPRQERPEFITLYLHQLNEAGHSFGPNSKELNETLVKVDKYIGDLINGLKERKLYHDTNLVVVSDHGMTETDTHKVIFLDDFADRSTFDVIDNGPLMYIYPNSDPSNVYDLLLKASQTHGHFEIWKHDEVPQHLHYRTERVGPIIILADMHWSFAFRAEYDPKNPPFPRGTHGYDINHPDMYALFLATGPYFEKEFLAPAEIFENVEIYPLLTDILGIEPQPHNGSGILKKSS